MRNIVRVLVYIWLIWVWGLYRYQNPTRYSNLISQTKTQIATTVSWDSNVSIQSWSQGTSEVQKSWDSIIDQIVQQLSWTETAYTGSNPFGETYITLINTKQEKEITQSHQDTSIADTSTCTTPRGRSVVGADWTLAFASDRANSDNVCVIEKRICTQWVLGGSYTNHTCYFNGQGWEYEYLGIRWSDSTALINQVEQQLGISTISSSVWSQSAPEQYTDNTQWVSNYALIDTDSIPNGRTNNGWYAVSNKPSLGEEDLEEDLGYGLWPIVARIPKTKLSASKEQQINPNNNGVQWVVNNKGNSPRLSYSTTNDTLEPTGSVPTRRNCKTPWGTEVFHNQHIIAFQSSSAPQWQLCKSEFRTCTQWYLRWSYTQQTCTIAWVSNTNTNDPYRNNGWYYSKWRYYDDNYDYNYYANGKYNDDWYDDWYYENNNYSYKSPRKTNNNCLIDWYGYMWHGSIFTMYEKSEVWSNDSCRSITRMCDDGDLSGSDRYRYSRCTQISQGTVRSDPGWYRSDDNRVKVAVSNTVYRVPNPNSVSPVPRNDRDNCYDSRLGTIEHSDSVKAFKTSNVKAGQKCEYEYRTCHNGDLDGSYTYNTCTIWSSNSIKSANNSISRYTSDDKYKDRYYVRKSDDNYYPSRWSRYDDYETNIKSYGTKSDPQAWSCNVSNYGVLNNSDFLVMYRETNPAPWIACDSVVRTCNNGSLGWPSTHNALRCSTTAGICGNGTRESGEQCDHKDVAKSWRWSEWCSLTCTTVQKIIVDKTHPR